MFSAAPMERLDYLAYPNDADVDALLSQLNDESLLKLKVSTHNTSARGFEYPTFTDGWADDDATGALDTTLTSRFSSLKRPIPPPKKKGQDSLKGGKKGSNLGSRADSQPVVGGGKKSGDSPSFDRRNRDSDVFGSSRRFGDEGEESGRRLSSKGLSKRIGGDAMGSKRLSHNRQVSRTESQRSEFQSFRSCQSFGSWDTTAAAADEENDIEDPDSLDALLTERFLALKSPHAPSPASSISPAPAPTRNVGLDNLKQFSAQQLPKDEYDAYGSSFSIPSSPSANLLGKNKTRSAPRIITNSVATSCNCSAPSALKLLKQVGSKSFPTKQQPSHGSLPPLGPATVRKPARAYKVEGFGNSKPGSKESEKEKRDKKSGSEDSSNNLSNLSNPSTVKDMRRILSSVADRVGLERSRVSSAVDDESPEDEDEDLGVWTVDGEEEFASASTEEQKVNREAERVVEWAKDAALLDVGGGDSDLEAELGDEDDFHESDLDEDSDQKPSKKEKPKKKGAKVALKKKKWGLF